MPEHRDIIDSERHEAKGASSALAGQVLKANGDGTTSFIDPTSLNNITIGSTIEGVSNSDQTPSTVDTPLQVVWGSGSANSDVDIASNGVVTFLEGGLYNVSIKMNFGRSTGAGTASLIARLLINGVTYGPTQSFRMSDATSTVPLYYSILHSFSLGDSLTVEFIRDSGGINNGGLVTVPVSLDGWEDSPSAAIKVQKVLGGV